MRLWTEQVHSSNQFRRRSQRVPSAMTGTQDDCADLDKIWGWNAIVPLTVEGSVHDLIAEQSQLRPDAAAVDAWDGSFTYHQLEDLGGRLAYALASRGVSVGDVVPIYLSKSKWMPIAMLGIIKAGATAVTLDINHPRARLQSVLQQTQAGLVITSPDLRPHLPFSEQRQVFELGDGRIVGLGNNHLHRKVDPSQPVYISFTSGTTGEPKGACMSHANVRSAVCHQSSRLGFHSSSRVLNFAPYSFDVAWCDFLHTTCAAGCLCIAQEQEMLEDLESVLTAYRCTLINVTPTVLRTLRSGPSTLQTILLSGETPYPENIARWAKRVRLVNTYGPTECTFKSAFTIIRAEQLEPPSVGVGVGCCTWLVDPSDNSSLVSIGAVGELYLEGPLVGQGYIGNAELSSSVFIESPPWLLKGSATHPGRKGMMYKTGDLARYNASGQLIIVGRKDTAQVKIRGQRVEVADVQHHARAALPNDCSALVDVVRPADSHEPLLALFIETAGHTIPKLQKVLTDLAATLAHVLPSFMHPTLYLPLAEIPRAATGKADSPALRQWASTMTVAQLQQLQSTVFGRSIHTEPANAREFLFREIWAEILRLPVSAISTSDSFLRLGGDSVKAIEMIAAARRKRLVLSLSSIFHAATLRDVAEAAKTANEVAHTVVVPPFSLLDDSLDRESVRRTAAFTLGIDPDIIEDIIPCTAMQQGLISMTSARPDSQVCESRYQLQSSIDIDAFKVAWQRVVDAAPLLRTRIAHTPAGDLVQVVISAEHSIIHWHASNPIDGDSNSMGLGTALFRLSLDLGQGSHTLVFKMHHAMFDGWSKALIFRAVRDAYHHPHVLPELATFQPFVSFVRKQIADARTSTYWSEQLRNCEIARFLPPSKGTGGKQAMQMVVTNLQWPRFGITPSSTIRAALAVLLSKYTHSDDVIFGCTVSGRQAAVPDVDRIAGPTFAVVPIRVRLDWDWTAYDVQLRVQEQMVEMHDFEQFGLRNIRSAAGMSCVGDAGLFQVLLVVQQDLHHLTAGEGDDLFVQARRSAPPGGAPDEADSLSPFNAHGMMLVASPVACGVVLDISYDTASLGRRECERFAHQLEHVLRQLCAKEHVTTKLKDLSLASASDVAQVLDWNRGPSVRDSSASASASADVCEMVRRRVATHADHIAVDAHDCTLTYGDLWCLSSRLARALGHWRLSKCRVPLCFDKSSSMVVAMLAVLRAGGCAIPVPSSVSVDRARQRQLVDTCKSRVVVTSRALATSPSPSTSPSTSTSTRCAFTEFTEFTELAELTKVLLLEDLLDEAGPSSMHVHGRGAMSGGSDGSSDSDGADPSDAAVVVFTSGTSRSSKAVLWTRRTLSSNVQAAIDLFRLNADSKVLQFASYDFDVSIIETFAVLCAGGRLCIPPQAELLDRLSLAINATQANWICLTPSVASLLDPQHVSSLRTVVLAGEQVTPAHAQPWVTVGAEVIVWYGPAEAPVATSYCPSKEHGWSAGVIGKSRYARTWIVDLQNPNHLAPIGAVGELCLQGAIVAKGYLDSTGNASHHVAFRAPSATAHIASAIGAQGHTFYRTGDHAKYDSDGNLIFMGRDTDVWVKSHGRRLQLSELEEAAHSFFQGRPRSTLVADVVSFADLDATHLVLFICTALCQAEQGDVVLDETHRPETLLELRHHLARLLPAYMIPTHFLPVSTVPLARTGKIDRRRLHRFAKTLTRAQAAALARWGNDGDREEVLSPVEKTLSDLWATVLGVDANQMCPSDHFFRLGGDSISAMRLVTAAREHNIRLTTAQVFKNPTLRDMSSQVTIGKIDQTVQYNPFMLLSHETNVGDVVAAAAGLCNVPPADVEDIYPCTALQQGLLALTARNPNQYVSRSVLELQHDIDPARLADAWLTATSELSVLRTRSVDISPLGLVQVVVKELPMQHGSDVESYIRHDEQKPMVLGAALCRAALIGRSFVLTIHHSIYDGVFLSMLLRKLEAKYFSRSDAMTTPFSSFVRYLSSISPEKSRAFWSRRLGEHDYRAFPELPPAVDGPRANSESASNITISWLHDGSTPSIVIQSAWALVSARFSMATAVIFGTVSSGRQVDLPGIDDCAGPTVCTAPAAVSVPWNESVATFHAYLRQRDLDALPYMHYGLQNIASAVETSRSSGLFQTLLVVHPNSTDRGLQSDGSIFKARSYGATLASTGSDPFNTHALSVSCWLTDTGMRLVLSYDDAILTGAQIQILMQSFQDTLHSMCTNAQQKVEEVAGVDSERLYHFWSHKPTVKPISPQSGARSSEGQIDREQRPSQQTKQHDFSANGKKWSHSRQSEQRSGPTDRLREQIISLYNVNEEDIEDIYPCTPLQESLVALSERRPGDYIGLDILPLAESVNVHRFRNAWETTVGAAPILRTRIVHVPGKGFHQVVSRHLTPWSTATSLDEFVREEGPTATSLGLPLTRYGIVNGQESPVPVFVLKMHHAAYDGITNMLIRETLQTCYQQNVMTRLVPFKHFVDHITSCDAGAAREFWDKQFQNLDVQHFPFVQSRDYQPRPDLLISHVIEKLKWPHGDILPSTIIRAAWAIVCSRYSNSPDVVFGAIVSGRQASLADIDRICGPTIAALPMRVLAQPGMQVGAFLQQVQDQALDMIPFEQTGVHQISKISNAVRDACEFRSMLVIQPNQAMNIAESTLFTGTGRESQSLDSHHRFNSHALMVICKLGQGDMSLQLSTDSKIMDRSATSLLASHFAQVIDELCRSDKEVTLSEVDMMTPAELVQLWQWNKPVEPADDVLVHDMIARQTRQTPDAIAISAWDGKLTYQQLDQVSTAIARRILDLEVTSNKIVPICFDKSVWTTVAFLGVVKAGCAVLILEPSLPAARLQAITIQIEPHLIVCRSENKQLCSQLCDRVLEIDDICRQVPDRLGFESLSIDKQLPMVRKTDNLYVVYTSGSSGTPKGCMITHSNMASAVVQQRHCHKLNGDSRMYDFSAYSFDAHHWCVIHTLCAGGTVCVPSDTEKQDCLLQSLQSHGVTDVVITPATARMIDPRSVPTLRNAFIVGDVMQSEELGPWAAHTCLRYAYGPTETTCWATSWEPPVPVPATISIGKGDGQVTWLVDPEDNNRLAPIGTVGELYLEGPLVGNGYLGNESATRAAFVDSPSWLSKGSDGSNGRRGRVYRTGDLAKYSPVDGNIILMGRRDNQIKLNGRRIELGEIERQFSISLAKGFGPLALAAEVVTPDVLNRQIIAVFLQACDAEWSRITQCLDEIREDLSRRLPIYMIPNTYVPLQTMPLNGSSKIDRKMLREIGKKLRQAQLVVASGRASIAIPATDNERRLQKMWSQVLHIPLDSIGRGSSYFRAGGDSITAMQLMSLARQSGFCLPVSDILTKPCLEDMADVMKPVSDESKSTLTKPFSLLNHPGGAGDVCREVAQQCKVDINSVEDCFPCTAVQKSLLAVTSKRPGDYIAHIPITLSNDIDFPRLQQAWETVSRNAAPTLRNRVLLIEGEGFIQAQLRTPLEWSLHDSIKAFSKYAAREPMSLGSSLTRLAFVEDVRTRRKLCILTQHHVMHDAASISLLLGQVKDAYNNVDETKPAASFQSFLHHVLSVDKDDSRGFWGKQFADCNATSFPVLPHEGYQSQANSTVKSTLTNLPWPQQDVTPAVTVRAAWAILSARYTDSDDVVFGVLSTGRQAPLDGIENTIAPLIAAIPVRVKWESTTTVHELLAMMQKQAIDLTAFEQSDIAHIQAASDDAKDGARYNALLVIQHFKQAPTVTHVDGPFTDVSYSLDGGDLNHFNPHAVMAMFQLQETGDLCMEVNFDTNVLSPTQANLLLGHFEQVLRHVCTSAASSTVNDISMLGERDLQLIWKWNAILPETVPACVHDLIADRISRQPDSQALCAWDGELTYGELDVLSLALANQMLVLGVTPGSVIPLCFEKSMWQPVAALATMRVGATCVSMDCTQPEGRLRSIVSRIEPRFILASTANESLARRLYNAEIIITGPRLRDLQSPGHVSLPVVDPNDLLFVVFTSGSTGLPKGVKTSHQSFATAATHQQQSLRVGPGTRLFDFVSYSFDVAWSNLINTLICGACLCIPSEDDRKNDIPGAFNRLKANYAYFTPTVAHSIDPMMLPSLRVLAMGGEAIPPSEVERWRQTEAVIGIYGPAECAQALCLVDLRRSTLPSSVGHSYGARAWLIEPGRIDRLAPIGAVGELVIEGPAVAMGYWNDAKMTKTSFLESPGWLQARSSTLSRVYKTGDLLRYNDDGSMTFIGRKDQMVKLRGQRIELSEVEHHLQKCLQMHAALCKAVAAEIIAPCNSQAPVLAAFVALQDTATHKRLDRTVRLSRALENIEQDLIESLPLYMIPSVYIVLDEMPMTTTDKVDRRTLRRIGGEKRLEDLASMQFNSARSSQNGPNTEMERRLQQLWSQVLGIDASSIRSQSSFLRIGGESISAMRLVAAARQVGISFTVADIFKNPRLSGLAQVAKEIADEQIASVNLPRKPFSLSPGAGDANPLGFLYDIVEPLLEGAADLDDIQDFLPATDFQDLAVREALQKLPGRLPHFIIDLPQNVDVARLRWACKRLVEHFEILRTVFVEMKGKVWQVQLSNVKMRFEVIKAEGKEVGEVVAAVCERDLRRSRTWAGSLVAFMVVTSPSQQQKFIFRLSHAQFDDHSIAAMLTTLTLFYKGESVPAPRANFGDVVAYNHQRRMSSLKYWRARLQGSSPPISASRQSSTALPTPAESLSFHISIPLPPAAACRGIPLGTIYHAACVLVLSQHFHQTDIVIGRLVTGRASLPGDLQDAVGPCLVEQPIRYTAEPDDDLWRIAQRLQRRFVEDASHEGIGMEELIGEATSWPEGCRDFGWRTAFQQPDGPLLHFLGHDSEAKLAVFDRSFPARARPELYATPRDNLLELCFEGNRISEDLGSVQEIVQKIADVLLLRLGE
ncbi:Nonribosomal peptide synthase atnA [Fulvia fulva]|uniref:Nonribosomal peptide synthase atnA n=1 Tax=Passalora fulva TaxID=5499 RepID=A0A9Q8PG84_PASFU|nr:Nonribosomal peptide synthase atnA [Fulvia fulva]KAK4614117.1 Nonribosomal peptide synthase atnA [Fulvia fulva]UJO21913.1 Nonribosomal peptide synthase atnA [Fulvia fulva]WPV20100.1 Nonribosomal peptide synthase atnA [Fulvia fulva]WPV35353.1 Nonribosomal peptide synthase atnA [Fulvia fulva]